LRTAPEEIASKFELVGIKRFSSRASTGILWRNTRLRKVDTMCTANQDLHGFHIPETFKILHKKC
jgi:hypothetical protein